MTLALYPQASPAIPTKSTYTNQKRTNNMSKQVELTLTKQTKATFVYKSKDEDPLISSLYLQKSQMPAEAPKKITVTVEFE
jgi:hypothetical protein